MTKGRGVNKKAGHKDPSHQGDRLADLIAYLGKSKVGFANELNRSRQWITNMLKAERLPRPIQLLIKKEYNVPIDYFEGLLPLEEIEFSGVSETEAQYSTRVKEYADRLIEKQELVNKLLEENGKLKDKIIELMEENKRILVRHQ